MATVSPSGRSSRQLGRHRWWLLPIAIAFAMTSAPAVLAHADLESAIPAADSIVEGSPTLIELVFTKPLLANSSIDLVGPSGSVAKAGPVSGMPQTMRLVPPVLEPGDYRVQWAAATDDGHIERGVVSFTVVAPRPTPRPSPTPAPSATAPPTAGPTPSATPTPAPSSPAPSPGPDEPGGASDVDLGILIAIVGVALVIGIATRLLLRQGRRA